MAVTFLGLAGTADSDTGIPVPSSDQAPEISLVVDKLETDEFGNKFNDQSEPDGLITAEFWKTGQDMQLTFQGFDIDFSDEIELFLNGKRLGYLQAGQNDGFVTYRIDIPAADQVTGLNLISFHQAQNVNWIWGITDLLLTEVIPEPQADVTLTPGVLNTGSFGNKFNDQADADGIITAGFQNTGSDIQLSFKGFDIDFADEIEVFLNGKSLGFLDAGQNDGFVDYSFDIAAADQVAGENIVTFQQAQNVNWIWGVTDLLVTEVAPEPQADTTLVAGVLNTGSFGNKFNDQADADGIITASFQNTGGNAELSFKGFDIDFADEIEVFLNGASLGFLDAGLNDGFADYSFDIAAADQVAGENIVTFQQAQNVNWIWGVTDLQISAVAAAQPTHSADFTLAINTLETGSFGNKFNGETDADGIITASFQNTGGNAELSFKGFDIDFADEIEVFLNGASLGFLDAGLNDGFADYSFDIAAADQVAGENTIIFDQAQNDAWIWGVTDIKISEVTTPQAEEPATQPEPGANEGDRVQLGADMTADVVAGRVATVTLPDTDVASVKVLSNLSYGNVTVNPDNSLAVVLTGTNSTADQSFSVQVTDQNGSVSTVDIALSVSVGPETKGWGTGNFYMLETDQNDDIIVEHGDNHREIYVSGSADALTFADIAAIEGINVNTMNAQWLVDHPEYGSSPEMALAEGAGMVLWKYTTATKLPATSNWLKFEAGYEYKNTGPLLQPETSGESELHPLFIGAFGTGDKPIISSAQNSYPGSNIVIQGLEFTNGIKIQAGENILAEHISITGDGLTAKNIEGFTLRDSDIIDVIRDQSESNNLSNGVWGTHNDRISGFFANDVNGLLIEDIIVDHTGWADDYEEDLSYDGGQPPSIYSHNLYLSWGNSDVTLRDSILMRAASFGAQVRSGGFIENNLFLDNNAGVNSLGGNEYEEFNIGNYSLFSGNVVTSGAHKEADGPGGALTWGLDNSGQLTSLVDNIVTHLADPNNAAEFDEKYASHTALKNKYDAFYDDTIVHNWFGGRAIERNWYTGGKNKEGLNEAVLDQTTIQIFAAEFLGQETATISDLADYLRAQADGTLDKVVDADLIIAFFQEGFGLATDLRAQAETLRFIPSELGEGVRWDNHLNWSTDDLPGTQDGDSVFLAGNWVQYGGTTRLENLWFGEGGTLNITHGYLEVQGNIAVGNIGGTADIDRAGQFWIDGYTDTDTLSINAQGGRFANTGLVTGNVDLTVSDNAQVLLATDNADFMINDDSILTIFGGNTDVGFDGESGGTGVLLLADDAVLAFTAQNGQIGQISEFYSGHFDNETPNIQSGVNLGGSTLQLNLTGIAGGAAVSRTLIDVDEIIGTIDDLEFIGVGAQQDASIIVDYRTDTLVLNLGVAGQGTGQRKIYTDGNQYNAESNADLWDALTDGHGIYPDDSF